jgi:hypothetical protein
LFGKKKLLNYFVQLIDFILSRTQWFSNPCAKGSYSYVPVGASSYQHIRDLAKPLIAKNMVSFIHLS